MVSIPLPIVKVVKLLQSLKLQAPIEVTELGMMMEVRPRHSSKALLEIVVMELEILMEARFVQS